MPGRGNNNWTREEHILAFDLYCKIPFGTLHMGNPRVIELASNHCRIRRWASSFPMRTEKLWAMSKRRSASCVALKVF